MRPIQKTKFPKRLPLNTLARIMDISGNWKQLNNSSQGEMKPNMPLMTNSCTKIDTPKVTY